ncbi:MULTISPECIES: ABC transporter ATP-binding protein [unclassified Microbacterium]|uniref:energy-coupling factor ABC transporter ATP-binding protein n=1 Tax=unclassified Microbacterium TaxID=2609290 RepID=UPI00214BA91A|nr:MULTISPECIES: ABC transporter ATP-binding protein [unclassified Microbacterium]MCR2783886.1 energy-coupling factor ABC transporter ATP-binding protein [Microbacterium sp. zg.B96]MDL5351322.1 ABC transporter ATP-binding protein [Microbacterium sp. zg-YB36]WIM15268.1 ABC transporter ATP-binding protein [Microbacterium sp. zg-B96]
MTGMDIRFVDVRYTYPNGAEALRGVNLDVRAGERVAIVGQNGAGKTTLARHLNRIFVPTSGTVHVGDWTTEPRTIAQMAERVGYVFQNPDEQIFARTVIADVSFGPRNLGLEEDAARERAMTALETVGLAETADVHPHQLALSERKRVALAGVLAMQTPVLVLDEPTTGQDARGIAMVARVVREVSEQGRTVIAITHDMDFCVEHFDRVIVMTQGQVRADGAPEDVFTQREIVEAARVEPPQLMRLASHLGWRAQPRTVDAFVDAAASERRAVG